MKLTYLRQKSVSFNMNCQMCGQFINYPLSKLKMWLYDKIGPLFCLTVFVTALSSPLSQSAIIVYMCLKWRIDVIFWLAYFLWTEFDYKTLNGEGRKRNGIIRNMALVRSLRRYFPLRLIKLADLPADRNYILACFPHGVFPFGCGTNFCTNANNVDQLFPDVDIRIVTLSMFFRFPLARELFMALGFCTANKENILNLLNSQPSKAVAIFPGGIKECLLSHPGNVYSVVGNRKGFIKAAIESGASLVPVFSFGEQNTVDQERFKSPILVGLVKLFQKYSRVELVIYKGRGYLPQCFGVLPHRRPVTTVVGKPIEVPKVENPSTELINEYHEKFYKALQDLFEEYKHEYGEGDAAQLVMVEVQ